MFNLYIVYVEAPTLWQQVLTFLIGLFAADVPASCVIIKCDYGEVIEVALF